MVVAQLAKRSPSDTKDPQIESRLQQKFLNLIVSTVCRKDKNKRKRGREWPIKKKIIKNKFSRNSGKPLRNYQEGLPPV